MDGLSLILIGVVALVAVAAYAMEEKPPTGDAPATPDAPTTPDAPPMGGQDMPVFLTSYWPFQSGLSIAQRTMEGGVNDRKGHPLHTLEDFMAGNAPYVSLAGDYTVFPYGQRLIIDALGPDVIARVVDTGGHFFGAKKVYRMPGHEPIDVCVASSSSASQYGFGGAASATVVDGDTL